jgi:hypothetical protein
MRLKPIALATAFALSSSLAFAQAGGNDTGPTVRERSGTTVNDGDTARTVPPTATTPAPAETTGKAPAAPSGPSLEPGGRDKSRVGGQGTSDRPGN